MRLKVIADQEFKLLGGVGKVKAVGTGSDNIVVSTGAAEIVKTVESSMESVIPVSTDPICTLPTVSDTVVTDNVIPVVNQLKEENSNRDNNATAEQEKEMKNETNKENDDANGNEIDNESKNAIEVKKALEDDIITEGVMDVVDELNNENKNKLRNDVGEIPKEKNENENENETNGNNDKNKKNAGAAGIAFTEQKDEIKDPEQEVGTQVEVENEVKMDEEEAKEWRKYFISACRWFDTDQEKFLRADHLQLILQSADREVRREEKRREREKENTICLCIYLYVCMYVFICLPVHLIVFLSVHLSVYLSVCLSVYLSICVSVYLSVCLCVCLSVYLSVSTGLSGFM